MTIPVGSFFKTTLFFNAGNIGWTEGLYYSTTGSTSTNVMASADFRNMINARLGMLHPDAQFIAARVSDEGLQGDSVEQFPGNVQAWNGAQPPRGGAVNQKSSDVPDYDQAFLIRFYANGTQYRSPYHIHGIPDSWMPAINNPAPILNNAFLGGPLANWLNALQISTDISKVSVTNWAMKSRARATVTTGGGALVPVAITGFALDDTAGTVTFSLAGPLPGFVADGGLVSVRGLRGDNMLGLNQIYRILSYTFAAPDGTLVVRWPTKWRPPAKQTAGTGTAVVLGDSYQKITFAVPERTTSKKVGRPFFVERGRLRREP